MASSSEAKAFKKLLAILRSGLQSQGVQELAVQVFSKEMISESVKMKVTSRVLPLDEGERTSILLDAIYDQIKVKRDIYYQFADILRETQAFKGLVETLETQVKLEYQVAASESQHRRNRLCKGEPDMT